jgi:hypothetical protein
MFGKFEGCRGGGKKKDTHKVFVGKRNESDGTCTRIRPAYILTFILEVRLRPSCEDQSQKDGSLYS